MILVLDHDRISRRGLCSILAYHGYSNASVDSDEECISWLREHDRVRPLLVVLSVTMLGTDGVETLKRIKSDYAISSTPVAMFSPSLDFAKQHEAMAIGAHAWIQRGDPHRIQKICELYRLLGGACANRLAEG